MEQLKLKGLPDVWNYVLLSVDGAQHDGGEGDIVAEFIGGSPVFKPSLYLRLV